jgi:hypothetical protein
LWFLLLLRLFSAVMSSARIPVLIAHLEIAEVHFTAGAASVPAALECSSDAFCTYCGAA